MRRAAAPVVLAFTLVASACSGGGRETQTFSVPEQVQGQVTLPGEIASSACRLGIGTGFGAEVLNVEAGIPASRVLQRGDVIIEVDQVAVVESVDLIDAVRARQVGETVSVRVTRGGADPFDADIELIEGVDGSGAPRLGIGVRTAVELRDLQTVDDVAAPDSPFTAVVSVDGSLYAVDVVDGTWSSLNSATPESAWTAAAGGIYVLEVGEPDRLVSVTGPPSSVEFVAEGWDGRLVIGSQAGLVLVYADREAEIGVQGSLFAVDPASGAIAWFWAPRDAEGVDNPIPIFAVSSPSQDRTLVGTAQFDDGNTEVLQFSLLDRSGEPLMVVPPAAGELPAGVITIGWYTDTEVAYYQPATRTIVLWNVDTGDLEEIELPIVSAGAQFAPVGDGAHFMMITDVSLELVRGGERASMRPLAVDCVIDQIAPPGFAG